MPLPDAYRMRRAPEIRMASTTWWVSRVPASKSMAGSVTARAMSGFEARWMTVSLSAHHGDEMVEVDDISGDDFQAAVPGVSRQVPFPTRREVVENGDLFGGTVGQEPVDEMAADEAGTTDDAHSCEGAGRPPYSWDALPFRGIPGQGGMADQQMPDDGTQSFGMRCDVLRIQRRHDDTGIGDLGREAAVAPHDGEDRRSSFGGRAPSPPRGSSTRPALGRLRPPRTRAHRLVGRDESPAATAKKWYPSPRRWCGR